MLARHATTEQLRTALIAVNRRYGQNIAFRKLEPAKDGKGTRFLLTVMDINGRGVRLADNGRRIPYACWHVHGYLFDSLFERCPDAVIITTLGDKDKKVKITKDSGNWIDAQLRPGNTPQYFSRMCVCEQDSWGDDYA